MITSCLGRNAGTQVVLIGALATLLLLMALRVAAENKTRSQEQEYEFDIPRTTRVLALNELSRQAGGLLLGYLSTNSAEEEALVGPVKGRLTVEDALRIILRASQLTFRWVESDMVSVEPGALPADRDALDFDNLIRTVPHSNELYASQVGMPEEVLVLGWPMRDLALAGSPVVVMERGDLDAVSAPTLPDLLRYISQSAYTRPESYRSSGAQYAEMRGLGPDTALVLINGRRAMPSANSLASSAFDLNTIPVTAVERIEFLLDSASAPYGADAIGGVINIVLRDKVARPTVELRYGGAQGGAEQERVTLAGGLNKDRFHGAVMFDYFEMGSLLGEDRELWSNQDYRRFGGRDLRSLVSNPGNVISLSGANLPGMSVPLAGVPSIDTTPGVSIGDFLNTPNKESLLKFSSVVPDGTRMTATATGRARLTNAITASAELLFVDRESSYHFGSPALVGPVAPASPGNPGSTPIPTISSNPFNPFGTTVLVNRLLTELPRQYQFFESRLLRWATAVHGVWGSWDWEFSALRSDEKATTWIANSIDMAAAVRALANPDPAQALNPFSPGPIASDEVLAGIRAPLDVDDFTSGGQQFMAFAQGPLLPLPAGPMTASFGGEWRNESMRSSNEAAGSFDRDRDVTSAFAQLRVPIVSDKGHESIWGLRELTLTAGARWDDYSDFGDDLRIQGALLWKPHREVSVRISGSESFRPPSLYDLHLPQISMVSRVTDPVRREQATINLISGGNTELQPATATSTTAGLLYSPESAMNWTLSADWWRIDMKQRQVSVPVQTMLANEGLFQDRIVRDQSGILRSVDASRINVGGVTTSGVDLAVKADFQRNIGRFTPGLQVTWFDTFRSNDIPGQPKVERVDVASELGSILEWRAIASLKWKSGPFGAVVFARHTPAYNDAIAGNRTNRKIAAQTLFDLQGSLDFNMLYDHDSPLDGLKLWLGAVNIFNEEPSYADVGDAGGFDTSQAELKERVFYLRIENKF